MRVLFYLGALIFMNLPSSAQVFEWVKSAPVGYQLNPTYPEFPVDYCEANGTVTTFRLDSVAMINGMQVFGQGWIETRDSSGSLLMVVPVGPLVNVQRIVTNSAGEIYAGGIMRQTLMIGTMDSISFINGSLSGNNTFLIKLNAAGQVLWKRNLLPSWPVYDGIEAMDVAADGNPSYAMSDFFTGQVNHVDNSGIDIDFRFIENAKRIGNISYDPNGALYISGASEQGNFIMGNDTFYSPHIYNMFIGRYDPQGNASWVHFGADVTFQKPMVIADNQGNAFFSGMRFDSTSFNGTFFMHPYLTYDFFAFKADASGNILWSKMQPGLVIGPFGNFEVGPNRSVATDAAGNFYIGGVQHGPVDWGDGYVSSTPLFTDYRSAVVKISGAGLVQWVKMGGSSVGNYLHAISAADGGSVYFTGSFQDSATFDSVYIPTQNNYNFMVGKINPSGFVGMDEYPVSDFAIYPNPTAGEITLAGAKDGDILEVFAITGQKILEIQIDNEVLKLPSRITSGIFLFKITSGQNTRTTLLEVARN